MAYLFVQRPPSRFVSFLIYAQLTSVILKPRRILHSAAATRRHDRYTAKRAHLLATAAETEERPNDTVGVTCIDQHGVAAAGEHRSFFSFFLNFLKHLS